MPYEPTFKSEIKNEGRYFMGKYSFEFKVKAD